VVGILAAAAAGLGGYFLAREVGGARARAEEAAQERPAAPIASPSERRPLGPDPATLDPRASERRWIETNNRARGLLEAGRLAEAVELFAACHAAVPGDDVFRRNLAEARFRLATQVYADGDLEGGIAELALAVEAAPERQELVDLLERWRRELELADGDTVAPGSYFHVEYDGGRTDLVAHAQEVLDFLEGGGRYGEGAYETLRGVFRADPVLENGEKIRVVIYDRAEFDRLTGLGDWAGGVFDGVIRVAVDDLQRERPRWERILRHELVHAFVREVGGRDVPGWLNEGLAQLHEEDSPDLAGARTALAGAELFPLEDLQESLATWNDPDAIARAYAQSLAFVAFLREHVGDGGLAALLTGCREGKKPAEIAGVPLETYLSDLSIELGR
jgi:tetratricopeptide (TPR) repeat protein